MSREIFIALSGGLAYQRQLDIVANNMANSTTVGFKQDRAVFSVAEPNYSRQARPEPPPGSPAKLLGAAYATIPETVVDMSGGGLKTTGGTFDLALRGEGFLSVTGPTGEDLYTRAGNLRVNREGILVTQGDLPVQGKKGNISITSPNVRIDRNGDISVDGSFVDRLRIVAFDDAARLSKIGNNMFSVDGGTNSVRVMDQPDVEQGALEMSNGGGVKSMLDLIRVQRNFETFTKVVQSMNDLDKKVAQQVKI